MFSRRILATQSEPAMFRLAACRSCRRTSTSTMPILRRSLAYEVKRSSADAVQLDVCGSLGRLHVMQEEGAPRVRLELHPTWAEDTFATGVDTARGMRLDVDSAENRITLVLGREAGCQPQKHLGVGEEQDPLVVRFDTPEKFQDVVVALEHGDVVVAGTKLECADSCRISTVRGDVTLKKVRSGELEVNALNGSVIVSGVAEATHMTVDAATAVYAKRVSGETLRIALEEKFGAAARESSLSSSSVRVDALYSPAAVIECTSSADLSCGSPEGSDSLVHVDSMHGTLRVVANVPVVETNDEGLEETSSDDEKFLEKNEFPGKEDGKGGDGDDTSSEKRWRNAISVQRITGNVDAHVVGSGDMAAHFDVCGGQSALRTARGSIELMVNHQTMATVELEALDERNSIRILENSCFSPTVGAAEGPQGKSRDDDEEEEEEEKAARAAGQLFEEMSIAGTEKGGAWSRVGGAAPIRGILLPDNARKELEHVGGAAKGKIDLGAARRFTSSTSFFGLTTATDKPASHRNNEYFDPDHAIEGAKADIPHIVAVAEARGDVTLESLSWMDSIKRKFMSD